MTGLTNTQADITGKQLQLLIELLPNTAKIAVMVRRASHASTRYVEEAETAARALGAQLQILNLADPTDLEEVLSTAQRASAVIMTDDAVFTAYRTQIADLALKNRLPFISTTSEFVNAGGLMSYGPSTTDLYRRAAAYVGKILNGAKAADLPVEQPTRFELAINLKSSEVTRPHCAGYAARSRRRGDRVTTFCLHILLHMLTTVCGPLPPDVYGSKAERLTAAPCQQLRYGPRSTRLTRCGHRGSTWKRTSNSAGEAHRSTPCPIRIRYAGVAARRTRSRCLRGH